MFKQKRKSAGFSLIGIIASLFIISIGLTGVVSLAGMSLKSSTTSKMRLIASGLAQEGIETIRDLRRANVEWDNWYSSISNDDYRVQYNTEGLISFSDTPLRIDTQGYYQYTTGNDSPFYRKVSFNKISANELQLTVEIKWKIKDQWSYLTVEDHLWNWK